MAGIALHLLRGASAARRPGSPAAVAPGDTQDEDERAIFEATFGLPAGIKWGGTRYVVDPEYDNSYLANTFVGQWEAWKVRARLAALAAGHVLQQFTISASDRFELTGAVGLLRGFGCVGPSCPAASAGSRIHQGSMRPGSTPLKRPKNVCTPS